MLKAKVDAGATRAITQFAFETAVYPRFRDRAQAAGIEIPIVPGLMPTTNFRGVARMAKRCGATVPDWLAALYERLDDDLESRKLVASAVLVEQVRELKAEGFDQFHFYTLNQAELTFAVCNILGIRPQSEKPVVGMNSRGQRARMADGDGARAHPAARWRLGRDDPGLPPVGERFPGRRDSPIMRAI